MIDEIVQVQQGLLRGKTGNHPQVRAFKGIPYAAAPVGELRWRKPQPAQAWEGVRDAGEYGNRCWQFSRLGSSSFFAKEFTMKTIRPLSPLPESEDCLYLNVWTSAQSASDRLPVVVSIHGGAFCTGTGAEGQLERENLCLRGAVVVSFNYRLGVLGFLAHPALADENGDYGNYGMYDQIAAIRWVRDNIAAFGGDPDRITLLGGSAGGLSAEVLNCSPLTGGLYQRAILQSSGGIELSREEADEAAREFVSLLGTEDAAELRALPVEAIVHAYRLSNYTINRDQRHLWVPTVDGTLLPDFCKTIIQSGGMHDIDYLFGVNRDDMDIPEMFEMARTWAEAQALPGRKNAYFYYFDRRMPGDDPAAFAYHGVESWYLYDIVAENWRNLGEEDQLLSRRVQDYWSNFITTGDPNGGELPVWEPYEAKKPGVLRLGLAPRMDEHIDPTDGEECPHVPWVKSSYR